MNHPHIEWDKTRTFHKIGLKPEQVRLAPLGHDAAISLKIGTRRFEALVPTASLGEGYTFVPAEQVGRIGDKLIIVLPASNDGTPIWHLREDELDRIRVS